MAVLWWMDGWNAALPCLALPGHVDCVTAWPSGPVVGLGRFTATTRYDQAITICMHTQRNVKRQTNTDVTIQERGGLSFILQLREMCSHLNAQLKPLTFACAARPSTVHTHRLFRRQVPQLWTTWVRLYSGYPAKEMMVPVTNQRDGSCGRVYLVPTATARTFYTCENL